MGLTKQFLRALAVFMVFNHTSFSSWNAVSLCVSLVILTNTRRWTHRKQRTRAFNPDLRCPQHGSRSEIRLTILGISESIPLRKRKRGECWCTQHGFEALRFIHNIRSYLLPTSHPLSGYRKSNADGHRTQFFLPPTPIM